VARGYFSEDLIHTVHDLLQAELGNGGARLDGIYYCPHHPSVGEPPYRQTCDCRKPRTGLVMRAAAEHEVDMKRSWMIGDRYSDVELASNANLRSAFVLTGYGRGEWEYSRHRWAEWRGEPEIVAENLLEAVERIINFDLQDGRSHVGGKA
jgi:D-glycero-D-manno-heptose 1,7-bisphosphate phosphatase